MATQISQREMILAYDGDCPMCQSTVALLERAGLVEPGQAISNDALSPADRAAAQAAGMRNQLVVLDLQSGQTRAGIAGILWLVGANRGQPLWVRLLALPGVRHVLGFVYEVVSYNRRVISPPRRQVRCDCEPEATLARRLTLIVPLAIWTVLVTALFGAAVFAGWRLGDAAPGAALMELAAGSGWIGLIVAALVLLRGELRVDYLAHLAVTATVGTLTLVPASLAAWWLPREVNIALATASVLCSFVLMLRMQRRRVETLGLSRAWLWAWAGALAAGFIGTACVAFGLGVPR
jgi:predicted DCC family thiol-disulfide oxidoreductase YuxK